MQEFSFTDLMVEYNHLTTRTTNLLKPHVQSIANELWHRAPCCFLVFGIGEDSTFWHYLNKGGRTLFLEDSPSWFEMGERSGFESRLVTYTTVRDFPPPRHVVDIFPEAEGSWDMILVDGPRAKYPDDPGRQQSILTACARREPQTTIYVHDYNRPHEQFWCDLYLGTPYRTIHEGTTLAVWPGNVEKTISTDSQETIRNVAGSEYKRVGVE